MRPGPSPLPGLLMICLLLASAPAAFGKVTIVPKWTVFEQAWKSSVAYEAPVQQCELSVEFRSPAGEIVRVPAFWDGGRTWRVRFRPDRPGSWSFQTVCSDASNRGLHRQTGTFLCIAPVRPNRFGQHGPVRLARAGTHFQHQDGTPFFWIADVTWDGARLAGRKDWEFYAAVRSRQGFTATQWSLAPGENSSAEVPFIDRRHIAPNLDFFREMDAKVEILNRAGMLSVIAPLWNASISTVNNLEPEQLRILARYLAARWGAFDVAWILDGSNTNFVQACTILGQTLKAADAPMIFVVGTEPDSISALKEMSWVDVIGFRGTIREVFQSNSAMPNNRPWLLIDPVPENVGTGSERVGDAEIRAQLWTDLLSRLPLGTAYSADGVRQWSSLRDNDNESLPLWQRSLFLPGAKQVGPLTAFFSDLPFWRLRPAPQLLAPESATSGIAAAEIQPEGFSIFYVSEARELKTSLKVLPTTPILTWIHPTTGRSEPAVAVIGPDSVTFPAPQTGDWILTVRPKESSR